MEEAGTRYVQSRGAQIAYIEEGSGPALVTLHGTIGIIALRDPLCRSYWNRLTSFASVIAHDPRGTGRSDPIPPDHPATVEELAADVLAIVDDAGIDRFFISAHHSGAGVAVAFADAHPERVEGLLIVNGWARLIRAEDSPFGMTQEFSDRLIAAHGTHMGTGMFADAFSPSRSGDPKCNRSTNGSSR